MSLPRQVLPGATYLVTRRCTQRQFLLRPCPLNNQIVAYCIAYAAQKTGIQLHALCVMSNHYHAVLTDPYARLPEFLNDAHKYITKCINASLGRWENLWASEPTSAVRLIDQGAVLDKLLYTLCNPVQAGLVAIGTQWPGVRSASDAWLHASESIARPPVFFSPNTNMPDAVDLQFARPPVLGHLSDTEVADVLQQHISARESELQREFAQQRKPFAGRKRVLEYHSTDSPNTVTPRRRLSPRFATKNTAHRHQAMKLCKSFWRDYREAYLAWRSGEPSIMFPAGTYGLRVYANVTCCQYR